MKNDLISRQVAIEALWKALYEYEDKIERQFQESDDLDVRDWIVHRGFVQNMSDIDRQTILNLPSAQPERKKGKWIVDEKRFGNAEHHCNLCGAILEGDEWKWRNNYFCYYCGAEMDERREDE